MARHASTAITVTGLEAPAGQLGRLVINLPQWVDSSKVIDILAIDGAIGYSATGTILAINHNGPADMMVFTEHCLRVIAQTFSLQLAAFGRCIRVNDGRDRIARTVKVSADGHTVILRVHVRHMYEAQLHLQLALHKDTAKYTGNIATNRNFRTNTVFAR